VPNLLVNYKSLGIGWKSKVMLKRATYSVSINKLVAEGNYLQKGEDLYCYLVEDEKNRKCAIIYLDGKKGERNVFEGAKKHVTNI